MWATTSGPNPKNDLESKPGPKKAWKLRLVWKIFTVVCCYQSPLQGFNKLGVIYTNRDLLWSGY